MVLSVCFYKVGSKVFLDSEEILGLLMRSPLNNFSGHNQKVNPETSYPTPIDLVTRLAFAYLNF
jgi:hypothetical protein